MKTCVRRPHPTSTSKRSTSHSAHITPTRISSSGIIWLSPSRRLRIPYCGGTSVPTSFLSSHGWHWITSVSLVRLSFYALLSSLNWSIATSVAVERVFSMGRHLLHFTRNRLSPRSIRAFLCLGDWGRRDLIDMNDIMEACNTKRRRVGDEDEEADESVEKKARRTR
ncbi:hypothetical protein B0H16DRAFT_1318362 [Mycena metata]|uniref:HAT C-terminal dimerisation domain-containing protein n=1 Tax=Mycena metata TaxID=1033252 RepID=A0AAD7IUM9_9AGAR|nr:hypothetical protein B0H16DRAFT_1321793 [Mycena metata]KAJ7750857.1 hypothetical protein B0H16DRAFT_1318362 [Mycena metata]